MEKVKIKRIAVCEGGAIISVSPSDGSERVEIADVRMEHGLLERHVVVYMVGKQGLWWNVGGVNIVAWHLIKAPFHCVL